jgi:hypothetical protein
MTASDYVPTCPDLPLASEGASTDASPLSAELRSCQLCAPKLVIQTLSERSEKRPFVQPSRVPCPFLGAPRFRAEHR